MNVYKSCECNLIGSYADVREHELFIALFKISADLTPEYQILYSRNDIHHYHIGKR
jgi:hypothetical protein